jgi:hypothetical protein
MSTFDSALYPPALAALLREPRLAPLGPGRPNQAVRGLLEALDERAFGPQRVVDRAAADACRAGLWLHHDFLDESHTISQGLSTAEGSYWHALMHRREPDFSNSKYWFRQLGRHPLFADLAKAAAKVGYTPSGTWDPFAFVDACARVIGTGGAEELLCQRVQRVEWELLFDWCYRRAVAGEGPGH